MRACPGCGLSLAESGVFCPSCGWRQAAATTRDASTDTPATTGAAPAGIRPTTPVESPGSDSEDFVTATRRVLGHFLVPAGIVLSFAVWAYAALWLDGVLHDRLQLMLFLTSPVFFVCLFVSVTLLGSIYPPVLDRYLALWDSLPFSRTEPGTRMEMDLLSFLIDGGVAVIMILILLTHVLKS
jgi:hypothetical protein